MPIRVRCPQCDTAYNLVDTQAGKKIRCKKCQGVIAVPKAEVEEITEAVAPPPAKKPEVAKSKKRSAIVQEEEDQPPQKIGKDKDDSGDEPSQKEGKNKNAKKGSKTMKFALLGGGVFLLGLLCLCGVGGYFLFLAGPADPEKEIIGKWQYDGNAKLGVIYTLEFKDDGLFNMTVFGPGQTYTNGKWKAASKKGDTIAVDTTYETVFDDNAPRPEKLTFYFTVADHHLLRSNYTSHKGPSGPSYKRQLADTPLAGKPPVPVTDHPEPKAPPPVVIDALALVKESKADFSAAWTKYKGKVVEVSGEINYTDNLNARNLPRVVLYGIKTKKILTFNQVDCYFLAPEVDRVAEYVNGQKVKVRGKLVATSPPTLVECELVEAGPSPAITISAAELSKQYVTNNKEASKKYDAKMVILEGIVVEVKVDDKDKTNSRYHFYLQGVNDKDGKAIQVSTVFSWVPVDKRTPEKLGAIRPGMKIKVIGIIYVSEFSDPAIPGAVLLKTPE